MLSQKAVAKSMSFSSSRDVFDALAASLGGSSSNVKGVIQFALTTDSGPLQYAVNFEAKKVERLEELLSGVALTVSMTESAFVQLANGSLKAEQAYMSGKLKVKGSMALAMQLPQIFASAKKSLTASAGTGKPDIIKSIEANIASRGKDMVKEIGAVLLFKISDPEAAYIVDLKNGSGSVRKAAGDSEADLVLSVSNANLAQIVAGKLSAQSAFMNGKLKLKGDMSLAMKVTRIIAPPVKSKL